jgi:hypothetical protein
MRETSAAGSRRSWEQVDSGDKSGSRHAEQLRREPELVDPDWKHQEYQQKNHASEQRNTLADACDGENQKHWCARIRTTG